MARGLFGRAAIKGGERAGGEQADDATMAGRQVCLAASGSPYNTPKKPMVGERRTI